MTSPNPQPMGVGPGDYDYVIITQDSWVSAFQPLADWKTQKGVPATIVTTDLDIQLRWVQRNQYPKNQGICTRCIYQLGNNLCPAGR